MGKALCNHSTTQREILLSCFMYVACLIDLRAQANVLLSLLKIDSNPFKSICKLNPNRSISCASKFHQILILYLQTLL